MPITNLSRRFSESSFLGMVNYYEKFIPGLVSKCAILNDLLHKNAKWDWTKQHTDTVQVIKTVLTSTETLTHYDQNLPLSLACDASSVGVGAVIFHTFPDGKEKPIAYASRKLSQAERNYAQIQKEALAIIYGVQKFRQYLIGQKFCLITDHKPLLSSQRDPRDGCKLVAKMGNYIAQLQLRSEVSGI